MFMRVGYLGPKGSFTYQVAKMSFPNEELISFETITEVIKAYEFGKVDLSVVPIENSIEGSVHETIDYIFHHEGLKSICEVIFPIKQQLLVIKKDKEIKTVYSHPQALAQSKKYLIEHYPEAKMEMMASTAYAAKYVAENPQKPIAAIAPLSAAEEYGLEVQARDIQEMDDNFTRFWFIGSEELLLQFPLGKVQEKISLALTLPNNLPGALYKALSTFAWREIDLTKIESRPLKTSLGEYFFIIDLLNSERTLINYAYEELTSLGIKVKVLGEYSVYKVVEIDN